MDVAVEKVMGPKLPTIGIGQPLALAVEMLDRAPASSCCPGGRPLSVHDPDRRALVPVEPGGRWR